MATQRHALHMIVALALLASVAACTHKPLSLSKVYALAGPYTIGRTDAGDQAIALSAPIRDSELGHHLVRVLSIDFSADVGGDDAQAFPFDSEILIFDESEHSVLPNISGTDYTALFNGSMYSAARRRLHVVLDNTAGHSRAAGSRTPLRWSVNFIDSTNQGIERIAELYSKPFIVEGNAAVLQFFGWTFSGGTHSITFSHLRIAAELEVSPLTSGLGLDPNTHREVIKLIVAYVMVATIAATAVFTVLSLVGWVKFVNPRQQQNLFALLIVELVTAAVSWFLSFLRFSA